MVTEMRSAMIRLLLKHIDPTTHLARATTGKWYNTSTSKTLRKHCGAVILQTCGRVSDRNSDLVTEIKQACESSIVKCWQMCYCSRALNLSVCR